VVAAPDDRDSTCTRGAPGDYLAAAGQSVDGMTFGLPREFFVEDGIDPAMLAALEEARREFEKLGAKFVEVSLPHSRIDVEDGKLSSFPVACYYVLCTAEASSNLARYDGVKYGHRSSGACAAADKGGLRPRL
jgi:aspartyl-tRNA(Asn)/glutamyl-tRNA(Gln) amidotransferase subunit A